MKSSTFLLVIIFIFALFPDSDRAQGEAAVPFLLLQPSPSLSAMGQTGTALPTKDPFGFVWNPAQLGYTSRHNNLTFTFYPSDIDWIPALNAKLKLKGLAFNAGYNFRDLIGFPVSLGFGYSNTEINFGEWLRSGLPDPSLLGNFESKDYYDAFSFGAGVDYLIQLNAGFTIKSITSILADRPAGEEMGIGKAERTVTDFGLLLNIPVLKLADENLKFGSEEGNILKPDINFSLGYSKSNIGDDLYYIDRAQADPLPRIDRLGYGITAGLDYVSDDIQLNTVNLSFTAEADDILISRDSTGEWSYQSSLSDLRFWKNIINIEGDGKIVSHAGFKIDLFETVSLSTGHFTGRGFQVRKTNGFELRAKGLFKLYALWAKDPITDFLRDHIDLIYYNTNFFAGHEFETKMTGLAFYLHNLDKLF